MKSASFPAAVRRLLLTTLARACAVLIGACSVLIGIGPALLPAYADDAPVTEITLQTPGTPEPDGEPVSLDTSVWTTDPGVPKPAIVLAHGFGGTKDDAAQIAATLARTGYTVITYTARGFGASGGLIHLGNPAYEGRDAVRVVDEAAARPEVAKDGDDPVIGFAGASYGGAAALLAAGLDPRVDAIVSAFTWHSLRQALVPQHAVSGAGASLADVTPDDEVGVFKQRWAGLFFLSGLQGGSGSGGTSGQGGGQGSQLCGRFATDICQEYLQTALTGDPSPGLLNLLDRSSMDRVLGQITAPTLIVQGEDDTLFTLDQADANFRGLPATTPAAMAWVEGGHDGGIDLEKLLPQWQSWFDRYLRNDQSAPAPPTFSAAVPSTALVGRDQDRRRADDSHRHRLPRSDQRHGRAGDPVPGRGDAAGRVTARRRTHGDDQPARRLRGDRWSGRRGGVPARRAARPVRRVHLPGAGSAADPAGQRPDPAGRDLVDDQRDLVRVAVGPGSRHHPDQPDPRVGHRAGHRVGSG